MSERSHFIYVVRPARAGFVDAMTDEEQSVMGEHFAYLQELLADGTLMLAGPCLDRAFGIAIFEADDAAEAERIMRADPAVVRGVFTAELHPFKPALMRP
jgi:uncharacterized protein